MRWTVTPAVVVLAAYLVACTAPSPPAADPFFANQQPFGATLPDDARIVTPEAFKAAAIQEGFTWDSLKLRQERAAAARTQFERDQAEVMRLSATSSGYRRALKPPPSNGGVTVLGDGNYLVTVQGRNGARQVVTEGPQSYFSDLLESRKRFREIGNQVRVYGYGYNALPDALKIGLPTPETLSTASLETVLSARRELAKRLEGNLDVVDDARALVTQGVRTQGVNPDARPANYPADPSQEVGFAEGSDRDGGCSDTTSAAAGLYQNFWWKQKFYATSVKDQGNRGTCPAFGLTGALETRVAVEQGRWVNLSEQRLWYQIAGIWQPRWYGDGANSVNRAEDFYEEGFRLPLENTWNYNRALSRTENASSETYSKSCVGHDENCSNSSFQGEHICTLGLYCAYFPTPATGERFKQSEPDVLFDFWDDAFGIPVDEMRLLLKKGHPMVVSFVVGAGFKKPDANGYVNSLADPVENDEGNVGRHVTQVVGFISNAQIQAHPTLPTSVKQNSSGSGGGYFIIKNSWGHCVADNGYYYVSVDWAKEFFTAVIAFAVNPSSAFKKVPNVSPTLSITAPNAGFNFPFRQKITLKANATDPDNNTPPTVTWSSNLDGLLGTGAQLEVSFNTPGTRTISAVAADGEGGYSPGASVTVIGVNVAPVATIQQPLAANVIYKGLAITLQGKADDNDSGGFPAALACSSLEWKSNVDGALGDGCDLTVTFNTLGTRTLTLTATDANGAKDSATVTVNVQALPLQGPPIVNITKPTQNQIIANPASNLYVTASAVDPDGGSPLMREWKIRYTSGSQTVEKPVTLKLDRAGKDYFNPDDYVPFNCGGRAGELELKVIDPQAQTGTDKVSIYIAYPPC